MSEKPHVLIVVQNLPVPLDRRVWLECRTLVAHGYDVSVICPKGPGDPGFTVLDGVELHKYRPAPELDGAVGYVVEFAYSWLRTARLSLKVWKRRPFQVLQACNPPDTYWLLARMWRRHGVKFVFDQHDLNPELFLSRFGQPTGLLGRVQYKALQWLEQRTYRTADHVISTNESYRAIAMGRGRHHGDDVTVVRSGPDTTTMRPLRPASTVVPAQRGERRRHRLAYLGIMGPQDGVGIILEVMDELVHRRGRDDVEATLMGFGDCYDSLRRQCTDLALDDVVTFTGRVGPATIAEVLSAAEVGLCPDPKTPLNDVSTMNKTMEYMAYAVPSVAFDLVETRVSGGQTCLYVPSGDVGAFCDAVERLLDDPDLRWEMSRAARQRVSETLDWHPQSEAYAGVFARLLPGAARPETDAAPAYVDLSSEAEFRSFVLGRGPGAPLKRPTRREEPDTIVVEHVGANGHPVGAPNGTTQVNGAVNGTVHGKVNGTVNRDQRQPTTAPVVPQQRVPALPGGEG